MVFHQTQTKRLSRHRTSYRKWNLEGHPLKKARTLNAQFSSVFTKESPLNPPPQEADQIRKYPPFSKLYITTEGIQNLLKNQNPKKAMGPERLHPRIFKEIARAIVPILQIIFSTSVEKGEVPDDWKQANIAPIFKKGEGYCSSNYRPVCVQQTNGTHNLKTPTNPPRSQQYPLRQAAWISKKRSTDTQLLAFTQYILANLSGGRQTDVIIMDFAKAFDKVPHQRLIQKLERHWPCKHLG